MAINNQNGSVKSSVGLSVTIHLVVVGLLLFAPQVKQLPIIKDLIGARTSTDMSIESSLVGKEEISVSYVEPEKNNIKKINSAKDSIKIEDEEPSNIETDETPNIPEDRISKSKVKKMLTKTDSEPETDETPQTNDKLVDTDISDLKVEPSKTESKTKPQENKEIAQEGEGQKEDREDSKFSIDDATKLLTASQDDKDIKLIKNPNPPAEIDHSLDSIGGSVDGTAVRDGRKLKQLAGNPRPAYPSRARLAKKQGTVLLKYLVTESGAVKDIRVVESSGFTELDKEALKKIKRWKFQPGQAGETTHPVTFKLNGPSEQLPSRLRTSRNG